MLIIRLQRTGRTNDPHFRVVVCEHTIGPKAGKYLEKLGSYDPRTKQRVLNEERIQYWLAQGVQLSPTMHNMLVSIGILKKPKINVLPQRKILAKREAEKKDAADKAAAEAAKNAPAPVVAEEKKEETPVA